MNPNPILKKMFYKGQSPVLLLSAPPEFKALAADFGVPLHTKPKAKYGFALAFARSMAEAKDIAKLMPKALEDQAVFWMAYPKGSSKKYKGADIHRDTGHAMMQKHGFEGVSLVALDEDWSAMRFKKV